MHDEIAELRTSNRQSTLSHGCEVRPARNEGDILPVSGQLRAKVAADGPRPYNRDFHGAQNVTLPSRVGASATGRDGRFLDLARPRCRAHAGGSMALGDAEGGLEGREG